MRTRWLPNTPSPRGFHPKRASWRSLPAPGGCPSLAETPKLFDIPMGLFPPPPRRPRRSQARSPGSTRCTFAGLLQLPSLPPVEQHLFVTLQTLGSRLQARVMQEGIYIDLAHAYQKWMMQTSRNLRVREAYKGL